MGSGTYAEGLTAAGIAMPEPSRAAGERLMRDFAPRMGLVYARGRNHDRGPGSHRAVSTLSPYVRRRLVTEHALVSTALAAHGPEASAKFVQEVFWRGYFKGWLERRPQVWRAYCRGLAADRAQLRAAPHQERALQAAEQGTTGIDCFDAWARELVQTGYLHNHARMWFASIWLFTLGLPWRLGADFFLRHLLDGDPASNTLGWRWVAGLHTRGKAYAAQAANIATYTGHRFVPAPGQLAASVLPLDWQEPEGLPPVQPLRQPLAPDPGLPSLLLITEEDCRIEDFPTDGIDIRRAITLAGSHLRSGLPVAPAVAAFEAGALADAARRAGHGDALALVAGPSEAAASEPGQGDVECGAAVVAAEPAGPALTAAAARLARPGDLAILAAEAGARQIVTPYVPEGPLRDWLHKAAPALATRGIQLAEWRRDWDSAIWPHATAGFFKLKQRLPRILEARGLA